MCGHRERLTSYHRSGFLVKPAFHANAYAGLEGEPGLRVYGRAEYFRIPAD